MSGDGDFVPARPDVCPVCATSISASDTRCRECGYDLAGLDGRPGAYSQTALWWTIGGFVAIYLIVLGLVAAFS
jgi:hypothetical protein